MKSLELHTDLMNRLDQAENDTPDISWKYQFVHIGLYVPYFLLENITHQKVQVLTKTQTLSYPGLRPARIAACCSQSTPMYDSLRMSPCSCSYQVPEITQSFSFLLRSVHQSHSFLQRDYLRLSACHKGPHWVSSKPQKRWRHTHRAAELTSSDLPEEQPPVSTEVFPRIRESNPWRWDHQ